MVTCTAIAKSTGKRCGRAPLKGSKVCIMHGASAGQVRRKAADRVATAEAIDVVGRYVPGSVGTPVDVPAALAAIIGELRAFSAFMGQRMAELTASEWRYDHPDRPAIRAEVALYTRALDQAARILVDIGRLGVEAAIAKQASQIERARAESITSAFHTAAAGLPDEQRHQLAVVFAATLLG